MPSSPPPPSSSTAPTRAHRQVAGGPNGRGRVCLRARRGGDGRHGLAGDVVKVGRSSGASRAQGGLSAGRAQGALGKYAGFVVAQYLAGRPRAFLRAAFHEALEVDRAVLAREVALAGREVWLPGLLVAAEPRVLADLPVRVRAQQEGVGERHVQRGPAVPELADAWEHRLDLAEERLRELVPLGRGGRVTREGRQRNAATRVVHKDAGGPVLHSLDLPRVLVAGVRVGRAVPDSPWT